jgi:hypothetical protein
MTNRERKEEIRAQVLDGYVSGTSYQECPNTLIWIVCRVNDTPYRASGFAKVQWPDIWDAGYGVKMATRKAVAKIVRAIIRGVPLCECTEEIEDIQVMFEENN